MNKPGLFRTVSILLLTALIILLSTIIILRELPAANVDAGLSLTPSFGDAVSPTEPTAPPEPEPPDAVTLQLAGDMLIHKTVYSRASTGGNTYDFSPYFEYFGDVFAADLSIINLEQPVDAYGENKNLSTYPYFNSPRELLDAVRGMGVDLCVTANNHAFDQKLAGVQATISNAAAAGLDTVGTFALPEDTESLYIKEINGIKIGVCAFTEHLNGVYVPKDAAYCAEMIGTGTDAAEPVRLQAQRLRQAGAEIVVACLHWGNEYQDSPRRAQRDVAQILCDAGVDILAGSHSHCVQPLEWTTSSDGSHKMLTMYSMGNLFANQTGLEKPKTQYGMVVSVRFERAQDGSVGMTDAFYMPTLSMLTGQGGSGYMRLLPAGQYAAMQSVPELISDRSYQCSKAYEYVLSVAGNAIPAVAGPDSYPEGFFAS